MAKTYLEAHNKANNDVPSVSILLLLDAGHSIGGTWDAARLYLPGTARPILTPCRPTNSYQFSLFVPEEIQWRAEPGPGHQHAGPPHPGATSSTGITCPTFCGAFRHRALDTRFATRVVQAAVLQDDGTWLVSCCSCMMGENSSSRGRDEHGQLFQLGLEARQSGDGLVLLVHLADELNPPLQLIRPESSWAGVPVASEFPAAHVAGPVALLVVLGSPRDYMAYLASGYNDSFAAHRLRSALEFDVLDG